MLLLSSTQPNAHTLKVTSNAFNRLVLQSTDSLILPLTFGSFWLSLTLLLEPNFIVFRLPPHFRAVVSLSIPIQTYSDFLRLPNFLTLF